MGDLLRAAGRDIVELFGFRPDDKSTEAAASWHKRACPFMGATCSKTNHDQSTIYGTCSVTAGVNATTPRDEVIICPKRLYADNYKVLQDVIDTVWEGAGKELVAGGDNTTLKSNALQKKNPVIAFGQNSGKEVQINSNGQLSMDWVLQSYSANGAEDLRCHEFVGVEVQSIDITGNYRNTWGAYAKQFSGEEVDSVPNSGHGLNWANVHKRLIPQIIRKGNVYSKCNRCIGFFFIVPDLVFTKFQEVIGAIPHQEGPGKNTLSVLTYVLGEKVENGKHRKIENVGVAHFLLSDVANAFISNSGDNAPEDLDLILSNIP
jgi:hypothetical protein